MRDWTPDELQVIGDADELQIAPSRPDGSRRTLTTIWVVRHDHDLYVRAYRGADSRWHTTVQATRQARIRSDGIETDVGLEDVDLEMNDAIDDAYRAKYAGSGYVEAMVRPEVRATTLRLVAL